MSKRIIMIAVLVVLFNIQHIKAQTYTGNLNLTTQAQVDDFNYTEVDGIITIGGLAITNLNGLSELTKCTSLFINCRNLTNVIGLANLVKVEGTLSIKGNTSLTNIDGFSSLTQIGGVTSGGLIIEDNRSLQDIDGLFSLMFARELVIKDNPALTNIDGLLNFTAVAFGDIIIENNDALINIDGLSSFGNLINGNLKIIDNLSLTNIDGLGNLDQTEHSVEIRNNPALTSIGLTDLNYVVLGSLLIAGNSSLTTLAGLENLDDVGHLSITNNSSLVTINALAHLNTIRGGLAIVDNDALINLVGLTGLDFVYGNLNISDNASLISIGSLLNFTAIGDNLIIKNNAVLPNLTGLDNVGYVGVNVTIENNSALTNFCALTKLFTTGEIVGAVSIINNGANTLSIAPPADIILNNDAGVCSRDLTSVVPYNATVTGCLKPSAPSRSDYPVGNIFPVGTTEIIWTATDAAGNTATAIQKIIITDNEPPSITCPAPVTVQCAADVPAVNINAVTTSDNCSVTVTHVSDVISNKTCANRFTVTRTYRATDASGNTADCSQTITVNDNTAPQITGLSTSKQVLAPPNHKMVDLTLTYNITDNCVSAPVYTVSISSNEPVNGTGDGDTDPDWEIVDDHHIRLRAERAAQGNGRIYTITVTANDGCNDAVSATTQVVVAHNITGPHSGNAFRVGSTVAFTGEFWDVPGNRHTAKWMIDGSTIAKATVSEPAGNKNGKITGSYKFTTSGVYKLQMNVTDQNAVTTYANTNGDLEAIVVIYDPNGGYTYGGGWYPSPAGALADNPTSTGKVSYGFSMNYFKNATNPKGEAQFEFKVGDFEFNALNFEYLVINSSMAQFKGTGKISGGQSGVPFTMTVVDGELDGTGVDKIRMKIYNKNGKVIYDNQRGASDAALPTQAVGANSIVVISGSNGNIITAKSGSDERENERLSIKLVDELTASVYPNPANSYFNVLVNSNDANERIVLQVYDLNGRLVEVKNNVSNGSTIRLGNLYKAGVYYVKVIQGKQHKELKLVKLN